MQALIINANQNFNDIASCQDFLHSILSERGLLPAQHLWQFPFFQAKKLVKPLREDFLPRLVQSGGAAVTFYVLDHFEQTSVIVQNTLLKTLEEPPANVCIILLTNNLRPILDTVQSRCRLINLDGQSTIADDFQPSLADLQFDTWDKLSSSQLAQRLIDSIATRHKELKAKDDDLTITTVTDRTLGHWLLEANQLLHTSKAPPSALAHFLHCLTQQLRYLRANVGAKNVLYNLAITFNGETNRF